MGSHQASASAILDAGFGVYIEEQRTQAATEERDRLRNVWDNWLEWAIDTGDTPHVVWRLLTADPEDTP
jgi:hypothetical protein